MLSSAAKEDLLLDAAAAEFNAAGIAGASLATIARSAGIKRAALYYYFDSREDLAYRCYLRACQQTAQDLAAARTAAQAGLARVLAFIEASLDPVRAPAAALSEVRYLGGARHAQVAAAHAANLAALRRLIEGGMKDGSIRACDAGIAAQAIFGIVSWVPLAPQWNVDSGQHVRAHAAAEVRLLVERGVGADADYAFQCELDVAAFATHAGGAFDRKATQRWKIEQIVQSASALFNHYGIDGTSLDDVTAALGATKGAFYQYFRDKRQLVLKCVERAQDLYAAFVDAAERHGANGLERSMIGLHLNVQAPASPLSPLSPLTGLKNLPKAALARVQQRATGFERRYEAFCRQGIADGSMRAYDVPTLATAGAGAFGWIPKWAGEPGAPAPRTIADETVALFIRGLRRAP